MKKVFIKIDDIDRHGDRCLCGLCNIAGRSYGVGLYDVTDWTITPEEDISEDLLDTISHDECFDRFYAPGEDTALVNARKYVQENGWILYE